jgi:hypothetical protein
VVAVTSECQPLSFFDLPAMLQAGLAEASRREQRMLDIRYELQMARKVVDANNLRDSRSWRLTAPLRRVTSTLRRYRARLSRV